VKKFRFSLPMLFASLLTAFLFFFYALPGQAQKGETGVTLRVFVATAPSQKAEFKPGPPIPEADLKSEADFVGLLRERNPGWKIDELGALTSYSTASVDTPDLQASIAKFHAVDPQSQKEQEKVKYQFKVPNSTLRYKAVAGTGASEERPTMSMPTSNEAYLNHVTSKSGIATHVIQFLTFKQ
jgi:hypothetical protein